MHSSHPWASALTDNFVRTEYRGYRCPIFVTVWTQTAGQAFTTCNDEPMQDFGPKLGVGLADAMQWAFTRHFTVLISYGKPVGGLGQLTRTENKACVLL